MPRKPTSRGKCVLCGHDTTRGTMVRHFERCDALAKERSAATGKAQQLVQLRAQDGWGADFWIDLEVRGGAILQDLDDYLRAIWLECCGHLSSFTADGFGSREFPDKMLVGNAFSLSPELLHLYDFGTTSETRIKVTGERTGVPLSTKPIFLLARNNDIATECIECSRPAGWLCQECQMEHESPGLLCDEHAEDHPHDNYGEPVKIFNSPRVGMCGYEGDAEPPY